MKHLVWSTIFPILQGYLEAASCNFYLQIIDGVVSYNMTGVLLNVQVFRMILWKQAYVFNQTKAVNPYTDAEARVFKQITH